MLFFLRSARLVVDSGPARQGSEKAKIDPAALVRYWRSLAAARRAAAGVISSAPCSPPAPVLLTPDRDAIARQHKLRGSTDVAITRHST